MAYMIGAYQYFDDAFLYSKNDYKKPCVPTYPEGSLQFYLKQHHPSWYLLLQKADRLNFFNQVGKYTMFVPVEEVIPKDVLAYDRQSALTTFNFHTLRGIYDDQVLATSEYQQLTTLIDGRPLEYVNGSNGGILNRRYRIVASNRLFGNVMVHVIDGLLC